MTSKLKTTLLVAAALALANVFPIFSAQSPLYSPTTGTVSGLTLTQNYNNALASLAGCNSGASAPSNLQAGPTLGQCWIDTSQTPNPVRQFDGATTWVITGYIDPVLHIYIPVLGGGTATLTAAATVTLTSAPQAMIDISGTTTITSFDAAAVPGTAKILRFLAPLTLTHNATSLILPGGANITTAAGDVAIAVNVGTSNWLVASYSRSNGTAVSNPSVDVGTVVYSDRADTPAKWVQGYGQALSRASYPDYFAAVSRTQTGTRTAGSPVITSLTDTSKFGLGQPVEGAGIQAGASIVSVTGSTITLSSNATTPGASAVTVILTGYGAGGTSATVGVKDCRGLGIAGRDDMGGTAAGRLTGAGFGAFTGGNSATYTGSMGGSQFTNITQPQLPNVSLTASVSGTLSGPTTGANNYVRATGLLPNPPGGFSTGGGAMYAALANTSFVDALSVQGSMSGGTTSINGNVTQSPFPLVQPTTISDCIVRVQI